MPQPQPQPQPQQLSSTTKLQVPQQIEIKAKQDPALAFVFDMHRIVLKTVIDSYAGKRVRGRDVDMQYLYNSAIACHFEPCPGGCKSQTGSEQCPNLMHGIDFMLFIRTSALIKHGIKWNRQVRQRATEEIIYDNVHLIKVCMSWAISGLDKPPSATNKRCSLGVGKHRCAATTEHFQQDIDWNGQRLYSFPAIEAVCWRLWTRLHLCERTKARRDAMFAMGFPDVELADTIIELNKAPAPPAQPTKPQTADAPPRDTDTPAQARTDSDVAQLQKSFDKATIPPRGGVESGDATETESVAGWFHSSLFNDQCFIPPESSCFEVREKDRPVFGKKDEALESSKYLLAYLRFPGAYQGCQEFRHFKLGD